MKKVILYVHEGEQKIVSKHCPTCLEIKLTADFVKPGNRGILTSICKACDGQDEGLEEAEGEGEGEINA